MNANTLNQLEQIYLELKKLKKQKQNDIIGNTLELDRYYSEEIVYKYFQLTEKELKEKQDHCRDMARINHRLNDEVLDLTKDIEGLRHILRRNKSEVYIDEIATT